MDLTPHFKTIAIKYSYSLALAHPYWDTNSCLLKIDIEGLKRDVGFLRAIIRQVGCDLKNEVKLMLRALLSRSYTNPTDFKKWAKPITDTPEFDPDLYTGKVKATRDPPKIKIFVPIPKIESNGCARSDSLICSLIF